MTEKMIKVCIKSIGGQFSNMWPSDSGEEIPTSLYYEWGNLMDRKDDLEEEIMEAMRHNNTQ